MTRSAEETTRVALKRARRIVIKIGSKSLAAGGTELVRHLAQQIAEAEGAVVLVSSGAIALGMTKLGLKRRPKDITLLQASAAAGQSVLMQRYEELFAEYGVAVAQVLLTHADLADRVRTNNARNALGAILDAGLVPIINENDAVSAEEIKFGDNDQLASMVVPLVNADLLILLSDVDGFLDEAGKRVPWLSQIDDTARALAGDSSSGYGTGGMTSKLEAARRATLAGAHVVIAPARAPSIVSEILSGGDWGTLVPAAQTRLSARKHWIAFTLRPRGTLLVDDGAAEAIRGNRSLLSVGLVGVRGDFVSGDAVEIRTLAGEHLAQGLSRLSGADAMRLSGRRGPDDEAVVVIHRDDLVVAS